MSIDGASHPCTSLPLCYWLAHARKLHPVAYGVCISSLRQTLGPPYKRTFCTHSYDPRILCASIPHLSIYLGVKGTGPCDRGHVQSGFFEPFSGKKRKPCARKLSRGNSYQEEECSDLETKILEFMDNSERPELFPSRSELMKAGRSDLLEGILSKGGWMVAGWDMELNSRFQVERVADLSMAKESREANGRILLEDLGTQNKELAFLETSLSYLDVPESATNFNISKETHGLTAASYQVSQSALAVSLLERQRGWAKVAGLFGFSKPEHGEKTHVLVTKEITKKQPYVNGTSQLAAHGQFASEFRSYRRDDSNQLLAGGSESSESSLEAIAENKWRRQKSTGNRRTYPPCNETVLSEKKSPKRGCPSMRSRALQRKSEKQQQVQRSTSPLRDRIRGLEAELISTLDTLKSGRQALNDDIAENQRYSNASQELEEVSDALEFCETEIMNKNRELRIVRAQQTALEGKLALDLMEFKKDMKEKDKRLAEGTQALKMLRTARIVWANQASDVFLAGSFDGWASWRRMEKSSAGVFVIALQLYPGQYEIKFVVNGEWRLDPNRPVTWANGFENNVLTIL